MLQPRSVRSNRSWREAGINDGELIVRYVLQPLLDSVMKCERKLSDFTCLRTANLFRMARSTMGEGKISSGPRTGDLVAGNCVRYFVESVLHAAGGCLLED